MYSLIGILLRILLGERLRKPSPREQQYGAGAMFLIGAYFGLMFLSMKYAKHFWDTAGAFELTIAVAVILFGFFFGVQFWGKHVPAKVSWILAAIIWILLFSLALTGHIT